MEFHLDQGEEEEQFIEMLGRGVQIGDILDFSPSHIIKHNPRIAPVWVAFFELSRTRDHIPTLGTPVVSAIPYSEILSYCKLYAISDSGTLTEHLVRMDKVWVGKVNKKIAEAKKREEANNPISARRHR